ncbi:hypothetical protein GCM10011506_46360 [Marivirga lumbricoides]|uniref:Histidine kinase n=1 Tax=Marivirga lumbricoides TaxID=1046115 RepID=A0A2T4DRV3_9BACT|nr:histidine kinase [Marivirga lumbricoides]GGC55434.1 hypothetical protein GCM10011506_46360 [Marivirga lumbricoides]
MNSIPNPLKILIIEDNKGDQLLVGDYLEQEFPHAAQKFCETCESALLLLQQDIFHLILLDLTLPDKEGEQLLREVSSHTKQVPIIILTGYSDIEFSVKSLTMGVYDYLLKDTLTPSGLYKSIAYTFERQKIGLQLQKSYERYQELFQLNPQPIFVVDLKTRNILDVNKAAIEKYGCTREEFLSMNMGEIQKDFDDKMVDHFLENSTFECEEFFEHQCKDKPAIMVDLQGNLVDFKGKKAILLLANDITERAKYISKIEDQNKKLSDIAWQQSHMVRAPLTRLMGLIDVFEMQNRKEPFILPEELQFLLDKILNSAHEIDKVIKDIVGRTYGDDD